MVVASVVVDATKVKLANMDIVDKIVCPWEPLVAIESVKVRERRGVHAF